MHLCLIGVALSGVDSLSSAGFVRGFSCGIHTRHLNHVFVFVHSQRTDRNGSKLSKARYVCLPTSLHVGANLRCFLPRCYNVLLILWLYLQDNNSQQKLTPSFQPPRQNADQHIKIMIVNCRWRNFSDITVRARSYCSKHSIALPRSDASKGSC